VVERAQHLQHAIWLSVLSIAWSGVAGSIAVYLALATGSLSLLGFGVDAVIDATASGTLVWRFLVETREPERAARVERAAERIIGLALVVFAAYLAFGAVQALIARSHPEASTGGVVLLVASAVVLPAVARAKYLVARSLASGALRADSILTAVAALLAVISLLSLAGANALGWWWADAVAALGVAVILVREGWSSLSAARTGHF
jgi:divalent metal cation (Fe/Co/Zn/Cd) transporter